ncbi:MAG: alpha/beta hydrolase [Alphaproteobacteria bacterium]|nr:alpha/beta hydrolase [Alphaproteobacteria bacterium]MBU1516089.1 alpha/beta hydrolase [Alphaproteobacteria bacterium]MBU2092696.1 alpha/beta hydrolase [Alphaproteobacteria bacterium]MBU2153779.1 alpha/beta hydrolase [Alphaproteobacteria bacterium]MBU2308407.1 alpha/beta hydrolase [Alphaproteobacteria bacterium]
MAGGHPCQGIYTTPKGTRPKVAFIATHYNVDFSEHYLAPYLAARGYGFLGWNTRYRGAEDQFLLEHAVIDIGVGVRWLKEQAGVDTVVILGNSGGGSLMGAYQAEAIEPTLGGLLSGAGVEALNTLPQGDLYISFNAHQGRPEVLTDWMDASVVDEFDPVATDESLNPFNPDNGPAYSPEFITRYRAAQKARNQRITDWAKAELERLNAAGIPDRLFPLFRCWGDLRMMDGTIDPSERETPMCYRGHPAIANRSPSIGRANNLKTWLSMWSLETSKCRGVDQLAKFRMPALVVQGLGDTGVFPSDAQIIFDNLGTADKQLQLIKGAHYFEDSRQVREAAANLVCDWVETKL